MQSFQQLSSFSAAEDLGQPTMEWRASRPCSEEEEAFLGGFINTRPIRRANGGRKKSSPPTSPSSPKVEKRTRKAGPSTPYLHPLPTIETIMAFRTLSRPMYDSLVRGEPPAQEYNTVIHAPKPVTPPTRSRSGTMSSRSGSISSRSGSISSRSGSISSARSGRARSDTISSGSGRSGLVRSDTMSSTASIDLANTLASWRKRNRSDSTSLPRSRASTVSSNASHSSAGTKYSDASSWTADSPESVSDYSEPMSPLLLCTPKPEEREQQQLYAFPSLSPEEREQLESFPALSHENSPFPTLLEVDSPFLDQNTESEAPTRVPSPVESFTSARSSFSATCDPSDLGAPSLTRSSAPSPVGSAYPSPPASPQLSHDTSLGDEFMVYPSPPPSPGPAQHQHQLSLRTEVHRERRAFSNPVRPSQPIVAPPRLTRSSSLSSHPWTTVERKNWPEPEQPDAGDFDIGAQRLDFALYEPLLNEAEDDSDDDMNWSMNGGSIIYGKDGIVYAANGSPAGAVVSPQQLQEAFENSHRHPGGLGLYVIDEGEEEE